MRRSAIGLAALLVCSAALAQQSASFDLEEHAFNAGGHPVQGVSPGSSSFTISIGSLGQGPATRTASSASFEVAGGFVSAYPPPGEVHGLDFANKSTLTWSAERSVGVYNLYRDGFVDLAGLGYGQCKQPGLADATATDADALLSGSGFFYLVTAVNRLAEEGTKGADSVGSTRTGNVCP